MSEYRHDERDGLEVTLSSSVVENRKYHADDEIYEIEIDPSGGVDPYWEVSSELNCAFDWNIGSSECTE